MDSVCNLLETGTVFIGGSISNKKYFLQKDKTAALSFATQKSISQIQKKSEGRNIATPGSLRQLCSVLDTLVRQSAALNFDQI